MIKKIEIVIPSPKVGDWRKAPYQGASWNPTSPTAKSF